MSVSSLCELDAAIPSINEGRSRDSFNISPTFHSTTWKRYDMCIGSWNCQRRRQLLQAATTLPLSPSRRPTTIQCPSLSHTVPVTDKPPRATLRTIY